MCGYVAAYVLSFCMLSCVERHVDMSTSALVGPLHIMCSVLLIKRAQLITQFGTCLTSENPVLWAANSYGLSPNA
jgi:hypothetical protein